MNDHEDLKEIVRKLFLVPDTALGILGEGEYSDPLSATPYVDASIPVVERLWMYEMEIREQLDFLVRQKEEFVETDPYVEALQQQGIALLLILRDFWRHFPELKGLG